MSAGKSFTLQLGRLTKERNSLNNLEITTMNGCTYRMREYVPIISIVLISILIVNLSTYISKFIRREKNTGSFSRIN